MVMKLLALLLLVAGGLEQSYGPYRRPALGGTHSTCAARGNVLLAWSEENESGLARIHVVLLDSSGTAISPIRILPALHPGRDAIAPSIGTDGSSFLVVWEESLGVQQTVAMALDPRGLPAGIPQAVTADVPVATNDYEHARVHWLDDSYVVLTGTKVAVRLGADGRSLGPLSGLPAAVGRDGTFAYSDVSFVPGWSIWSGIPSRVYYVRWYVGQQAPGSQAVSTQAPSTPYITASPDAFLVTWATGAMTGSVHYRFTNAASHAVMADVDSGTRLRADCTQAKCVIVYATRHGDVEGFVVDPARPQLPAVHFSVAATQRAELEPEIVMITETLALVSWRSSGSDGEWLAGRPLYLGAPKQRAVR
jgi:hypothetical protein